MNERWRWRIWGWLCKLPSVCPANAHTLIIGRDRRDPRIDAGCHRDYARNGVCWCGKLRAGDGVAGSAQGESARCPTCDSYSPTKHPAMQADGGEVQLCRDLWHASTEDGRRMLAQAQGESADEYPSQKYLWGESADK